ncbi:MAG: hypothetical protein NVSMB49_26320 [Ktedonobacteraceae bacterium]
MLHSYATQTKKQVHSTSKRVLSFLLLLLTIILVGCGDQIRTSDPSIINASYRPFRVVQACFTSSSTYPRSYLQGAGTRVADLLDAAVTPNQDGLVAFANVESKPADPAQYTITTVSIPKILPDPARPIPIPTPLASANPFDKTKQKEAQQHNEQATSIWTAQINANHRHVHEAQAAVKMQTAALRYLSPTSASSDLFGLVGCVDVGSMHFANTLSAKHILILVPDLSSAGSPFQLTFLPLYSADVWVIYRYCQQVSTCPAADAKLRTALISAGASSVHILDAAESQLQSSLL